MHAHGCTTNLQCIRTAKSPKLYLLARTDMLCMIPHRLSFKARKTRMLTTLQRIVSYMESTTQYNRIPVAPVFLGVCAPSW
ncbi:hypothetical protein BS17DRAFT_422787 [Gyrodon lividus]|nr:hypothetical protein BS17DRAFT_422787 [Gyrodon lividus]